MNNPSFSCVMAGSGGVSGMWYPALKAEGVRILAVADPRKEVVENRMREFGITDSEITPDLKTALRHHRPDFVLDLTVPETHGEVTCAALRAGRHVIGEKPMAADMKTARRMVRTAEETGRMYMVSQSRRWEIRHMLLRQAVKDGRIGTLTALNCDFYIGAHFGGFRDTMPSPLLLDMAIHHFDLARLFAGASPVAVYAHEFNPHGSWYQGAPAASCIFEMDNGAVFTYRGSWCAEGCHTSWNGDWRVIGDQGTLLCEKDQLPHGQAVAGDRGTHFHRPLADIALPPAPDGMKTAMHGGLVQMLDFLRTGKVPETECHDNIRSLAMVFAAIESAKKRRRVRIRV